MVRTRSHGPIFPTALAGYKEEKEMNEVAQWESGGIKPELSQYESRYSIFPGYIRFLCFEYKVLYDILMQS